MIKKIVILFIILIGIAYLIFFKIGNIDNEYTLKLNHRANFSEILDSLNQNKVIKHRSIFDLTNLIIDVKFVPKGYYKISKSMTSFDLLRKLRNGHQDPIKFTISTATFIDEIAVKAGDKMLFDSLDFMRCLLSDSNKLKYGYDDKSVLTLFLPNTFEFYWTSSPQQFIDKWAGESSKFWNGERLELAKKMNLSPSQVYILASLVQKEYYIPEERSRIAGVLINRLNLNMPLQVDATCKYATRDFAAKRVLSYHTSYPSEHNTYLNKGLPPTPICVPEISTIEAVLRPEVHDNIYYCADPSLNGYHIFSKSLTDHESVASQYRQKMNEKGIH